jgi:antitoxin VapB
MGELKPTAEIEELARRLAELEGRDVNDAVADALRAALVARAKAETPSQTAARILDKHGVSASV